MKIDVGSIHLDSVAYRFAFMAHIDTTSKNNPLLFIVAFSVYRLPGHMFLFEQADAIPLTRYVDPQKWSIPHIVARVAVVTAKNRQYTYAQLS
jgi:hypothetical protein